jgi:hypothetical protein
MPARRFPPPARSRATLGTIGDADREMRKFWIILAVLLILIIAVRVVHFLPVKLAMPPRRFPPPCFPL